MTDFLLELRCEEIPARMQAGARADLERLFRAELAAAGVAPGEITVWSSPRRLALIARDLPAVTEAVNEEVKGPRVGAPAQAIKGFLRKTGLAQEQLVQRDGTWFAITEKPGRAMKEVLAGAVPAVIRAFPWPKSMRWGAASVSTESLRWVRPLSGIVAILGDELVPFEIGGITSGYATRGHRFHCPGEITIGGAHDYAQKLRACHVIVNHGEREAIIREKAAAVAAEAGLVLVEDEGLVAENAGLTEWPVPLLGQFDEAFLEVPPEVIQLTARTHQKYFICRDPAGRLANAFVCIANIAAVDGGAGIVDGNRKVLAARLSDARFFWQQDRKKTLAQHAEGLARITFHEKLGTVADKAARVAKLAEWLAREGIVPNCDPALARQAAELCKADLVTEMVGEFPELQGVMGSYYARAEELPDEVADAIRDHYKPVGQGDDVPTAPVTVAVSLADKLDILCSFFAANEKPTGSKDPFALRRASFGVLSLMLEGKIRLRLLPLIKAHLMMPYPEIKEGYGIPNFSRTYAEFIVIASGGGFGAGFEQRNAVAEHVDLVANDLLAFFAERLKVQQREAGVRHDLIDAVFALGGEDDLVRLLARVKALQAFIASDDGENLLVAYRRAANILKKEGWQAGEPKKEGWQAGEPKREGWQAGEPKPLVHTPEPAEAALIAALETAEPRAQAAIETEDFARAMAALATLRGPIDRFFDEVTVNDPDPAKRASRLDLLARFRAAVHKVADFSKIEG